MKEVLTIRQRFGRWICKHFGHKKVFSHNYNNHNHYVCTRCGRLISEEVTK